MRRFTDALLSIFSRSLGIMTPDDLDARYVTRHTNNPTTDRNSGPA
jgi:hypothetical protein